MNPRNNICPDADFILRGHRFEITSLGFLSGTSHLVVGDVGGNLSLWSLESRRLVSRASLLHDHIISVKNFKNNQILTQGRDQKVKLMDLTSSTFEINSPLCTFQAGSYTFCEMDVDSENNWMILPAENPHSLQLWDLQQREPLCILKSEKEKFGICMACRLLSLGAQHFAFAGYEDGSVVLWCLKTRKILHRARYYDSPVMSLDVAANGIGFSGASGKKVVKFALNQNKLKFFVANIQKLIYLMLNFSSRIFMNKILIEF